jgi:hypothetical protein
LKLDWAKKIHETPSHSIKAKCGGVQLSPSYAGSINKRMSVQAGPGIN